MQPGCKVTLKSDSKILIFTFVLSIQLLPDQASLLNRTKAQICNPLKNLQSAYKSVLVSYVLNDIGGSEWLSGWCSQLWSEYSGFGPGEDISVTLDALLIILG